MPAPRRAQMLAQELPGLRRDEAIATGGELSTLLTALQVRQARRDELQASRAVVVQHRAFDRGAIETSVRERLSDWRSLLTKNVQDGRELLRRVLLDGPIRFVPENGLYRLNGVAAIDRLLGGADSHQLVWRPQLFRVGTRSCHSLNLCGN